MSAHLRPWWTRLLNLYGGPQVWRSVETWRRRDSFLFVGVFTFAAYLLGAVAVFAPLGWLFSLGAGVIAVLVAAVVVSETVYAVRPNQERLARSDRLVIVAFVAFVVIVGRRNP